MRRWYALIVVGLIAILMLSAVSCKSKKKTDGGDKTPSATSSGEVPGVTDTEVTLGTHTSLTGPIAAYRVIPDFTKGYFDYINSAAGGGGVNGRKITYIEKDDQYSSPLAVSLVTQLVEQNHIFAMFNALGTPNHEAVIDYLQQNGVPDMFVATGATEWVKDPSARPLVFGSNPNYTGEGLAIGKYIAANYKDKKVGVVYQNDDFGQDGLAGIQLAATGNFEVTDPQPYEVTDVDLYSQVERLRADNADVLVLFSTPLVLGNAIKHARQDLNWDVPIFISAVSMNELTAAIAAGGTACGITSNATGCNIEGVMGPVATYMAQQTNIPGIQAHLDLLDTIGIGSDKASVLDLYAQYVGELMVETLKRAEEPLTRASLVAAAESIHDWKCSVCLFPLTLGPDDHDPGQGVAFGKFNDGGKIEVVGPAYSWEGVKVADLSLDKLTEIDVPADAMATP
jgi:branched-chain amino acid transport system substrate-binding protein